MKLSDMNAEQGFEKALRILLENGFHYKYSKDYQTWIDYAGYEMEDFDPDSDWHTELSIAYECLDYVETKKPFADKEGQFAAILEAGPTRDDDMYFVVLALTDGTETKYFRRETEYNSYDGPNYSLAEYGETQEVTPKQVMRTEWNVV